MVDRSNVTLPLTSTTYAPDSLHPTLPTPPPFTLPFLLPFYFISLRHILYYCLHASLSLKGNSFALRHLPRYQNLFRLLSLFFISVYVSSMLSVRKPLRIPLLRFSFLFLVLLLLLFFLSTNNLCLSCFTPLYSLGSPLPPLLHAFSSLLLPDVLTPSPLSFLVSLYSHVLLLPACTSTS